MKKGMKKKIIALALVAALGASAAIGGTLAYFTDTDAAENVFTTGNVNIDLQEDFNAENAKLIPGVDVEKAVRVQNTGSEDAYVRVHIAVPALLDSGVNDNPALAAYNNTLHWNFSADSVSDLQWSHFKTADNSTAPNPAYPNWAGNGNTNCNTYVTTIGGVEYNVYVLTYTSVLGSGEITGTDAIEKVYLDTKVTQEQYAGIEEALGGNIKVLVAAEGTQAATFTDAHVALDTAFGKPGTYKVNWEAVDNEPVVE